MSQLHPIFTILQDSHSLPLHEQHKPTRDKRRQKDEHSSNFEKHKIINQVDDDDYSKWILRTSNSNPRHARRKMQQQQQPAKSNVVDLLSELKSCSRKKDLNEGRRIHTNAEETGKDLDIFVAAALINMYAKCGSMVEAQRVFNSIQEPDVVSWTALILGYADNEQGLAALDCFAGMKIACGAPNSVTYVAAIKACTSLAANGDVTGKSDCLKRGREIHTEIGGHHMNHFVRSTLINMYAMGGSMMEARRVFDSIKNPDVVSWNALTMGYADNGESEVALDFFMRMKTRGCSPNSVSYIAAIKSCTSLAVNGDEARKAEYLKRGREIHSEIGWCEMDNNAVQITLIHMYAKLGRLMDAWRVFDNIKVPNVVSWNALILGCTENGEGQSALKLFSRMKTAGVCAPNSATYIAVIKACTDGDEEGCLERARELHSEIGHNNMDHFVESTLINMYAKLGSMADAQRLFDSIEDPITGSWNALIQGYADNGEGGTALDLFFKMKSSRGCAVPNSVTYIAVIKACASLGGADGDEYGKIKCLKICREIHLEIGNNMDHFVETTLINIYARLGSMVDARRVFDSIDKPDLVSWTTLILGYAENGDGQTALDFFSRMKNASDCVSDSVTYVAAIKACGSIGALAIGRKFHSEISDFDVQVVTSLVDFYAKCGSMVEAREVFDTHLRERNIATWTVLLAGYGRFGDTASVFTLFEAMHDQGLKPDAVIFVCILLCCSHAGLVEKAKEYIEAMPVQYGIAPTVIHYNCMVDVLGRANKLNEAVALLQKMSCTPNAVTWMTLLGACRKWKNVAIGRLAFQSLGDLDEKTPAAAYILMAQIYGSKGMWEEQKKVLKSRRNFGMPGQAYVMDGVGGMVKFVVGEEDPPQVKDKLKQFLQGMKAQSYGIESSCSIAEKEEEAVCGHSERRAVVYGILKTPPDEPIRAFKNMRMCDECHWVIKNFSKLSQRVVIVRDESRFHVMENGNCSCGE